MKSFYKRDNRHNAPIFLTVFLTFILFVNHRAFSQAEVEPWGNIIGIRKQGQLFEFESSLKVIGKDGMHIASTAKERQRPHFKRNGDEQIVTSNLDSLFFKETVKDISEGDIKVSVVLTAHSDIDIKGVYFCVKLPSGDFKDSHFRALGTKDGSKGEFNFSGGTFSDMTATGIEVNSKTRKLAILGSETGSITLKNDTNRESGYLLLFAVNTGGLHKGDTVKREFTIKASGDIDTKPVNLTLNTTQQGRAFDGLGGNFRLQNPKGDPQVIDYCLKNMRVAWGRVELPWRFWQPDKNVDPVAVADSGKLAKSVKNAMEMAHRLDSLGIPLILSAWFPPDWAVEGKVNFRPVNGIWGNSLNKDNMAAIYKSIGDYIQYLKNKFGTEIKFFSFNESDLGINVRVTAQEHDDFIKSCGEYFTAHGIKTKMLLGDNSDATTYKFIDPAMDDAASHTYIGAVSFHSWRGWEAPILEKWASAATKLNLPLLVAEGSIDAAAYSYPDIFQEQTYALKEINLYVRLLAICRPTSILQWQLTSDYSPLIGGGIFGNTEPLHPGQRFFNLKQLSITPKGLFAMPITCDGPNISCAALGDNDRNIYAIHLVNNGTKREITLSGLPAKVKLLHMYITNKESNMKDISPVKTSNRQAKFTAPAISYITLISE